MSMEKSFGLVGLVGLVGLGRRRSISMLPDLPGGKEGGGCSISMPLCFSVIFTFQDTDTMTTLANLNFSLLAVTDIQTTTSTTGSSTSNAPFVAIHPVP